LTLLSGVETLSRAQESARLRRNQSFLGIHFDFHATGEDSDIGKNTTPEMIHDHLIDFGSAFMFNGYPVITRAV
jgi:hypothetical protein